MSNIQFEEDQQEFTSHKILGENVKPKMASSLVKMGLVKSDKQAGHLLVAVTIVCFAISFYLYGNLLGLFDSAAPQNVPIDVEMGV